MNVWRPWKVDILSNTVFLERKPVYVPFSWLYLYKGQLFATVELGWVGEEAVEVLGSLRSPEWPHPFVQQTGFPLS